MFGLSCFFCSSVSPVKSLQFEPSSEKEDLPHRNFENTGTAVGKWQMQVSDVFVTIVTEITGAKTCIYTRQDDAKKRMGSPFFHQYIALENFFAQLAAKQWTHQSDQPRAD